LVTSMERHLEKIKPRKIKACLSAQDISES